MKVIIAVSSMLAGGKIVRALKEELGDDPRGRIAIIYPASVPGMHKAASDLSAELGVNKVIVDGRVDHSDEGKISEMLKEYEESNRISTLIVISPECILRLTSDNALVRQWVWGTIPLLQSA